MHTIYVVNIKCGGCGKQITEAMEKLGLTDVEVSPENQTVSFNGDNFKAAVEQLERMGYPEASSPAAKRLSKKAKSFVSCAIGRWG